VIALYSSNPHLPLNKPSVSFVGEEGDDFSGLIKDYNSNGNKLDKAAQLNHSGSPGKNYIEQ